MCGIDGKTVCNTHSNPTESALVSRPHEGRQGFATLLELKTVEMMSFCPANHSRQISGQHSSNNDRLKAKQQCESGMRRRVSGNPRNLPKLHPVSRLLLNSLALRLAQTAPTASQRVHSYLPFSLRPPSTTPSLELPSEGQ